MNIDKLVVKEEENDSKLNCMEWKKRRRRRRSECEQRYLGSLVTKWLALFDHE